jgi:hypothetical protein
MAPGSLTILERSPPRRDDPGDFYGLPTGALDAFITFRSYDTLLYRRTGFPSYSWVDWKGLNHL